MRYAWFVVLMLGTRFAFAAIKTLPEDGDLGWQRWLGRTILATHYIPRALGMETFTAPGAPWTPQEWLFSLLVLHTVTPLGWIQVALGMAFCATLALALTAWRAARLGGSPWFVALVTALTGMAMYNSFGMRAQVLGWPMLALVALLLDGEGPWMWVAVPVTALWSNLHASAMLAPFLAGATAIDRLVADRAWTPRVRRGVLVCGAILAAVCCNPFGIGLPLYAVSLLAAPFKTYIEEWQSSDVSRYAFVFGSLPLLACAMAVGVARGRRRVQDALIFAAFTFLLLFARRNISLFAIAIAPLVARELTSTWGRRRASSLAVPEHPPIRAPRFFPAGTYLFVLAAALMTFAMTVSLAVGSALLWRGDRLDMVRPAEEIAFLSADPRTHRIFCTDFAWCSFFLDMPRERVFLDGRADPYASPVWRDYATIAYLRPHWRQRLAAYGIDAVLAVPNAPLDQALAAMPRWRLVASEKRFDLWMRE